jgi:hypothetical protein
MCKQCNKMKTEKQISKFVKNAEFFDLIKLNFKKSFVL